MKYTVRFETRAARNLRSIERFLADMATPAIAAAYTKQIIAYYRTQLGTFPLGDRNRDDLRPGLHVVGLKKRVAIAYLVDSDRHIVSIIDIFYGGQNWESFFVKRNTDFHGAPNLSER